jgi:predicted peroxiredoxin
MTDQKKENIVYVLTKGSDNPEIAIICFTHAVGALAMDVGAKLVLMGPAVNLAQKGAANHVKYGGLTPLGELLASFQKLGGEIYLCTPCVKNRDYDEKTDMLEQAQMIGAAAYTEMLLGASAVVNY